MVIDRVDRFPLFVPVLTSLGLVECWSENVSLGGVGLLARPGPQGPPRKGMALRLQFSLPDESTLQLDAVVSWVVQREGGVVAFGVAFQRPPASALERIARLATRPVCRVIAVGASAPWRRRLGDALGAAIALDFVDDVADVPEIDVAAVIRCDGGVADGLRPAFDEAPRLLLAKDVDAEVVRLLRTGVVHGAIQLDDDDDTLRDAIYAACRDWNARHALRRTAMRLTRDLHSRPAEAPTKARRGERRPAAIEGDDDEPGLVADSAPMKAVLEQIAVVAPHKVVVLIEGETGAGKELTARVVHQQSSRKDRPFIVQDCGTLTETLLDSELFGHVRGAFTGANADHPGIFVVADGGTVFLDEIQNTSPALQAKLLRVLETGEVRPVGGSRVRVTDVRIVAAANVDLQEAVRSGRFRADLYYRLTVFPIRLPPLRERGRDIVILAHRLAAAAAAQHGLPRPVLHDDVAAALQRHPWPGNVRQLKNVLERAVLVAGGGVIALRHLPLDLVEEAKVPRSLDGQVRAYERALIARALVEHGGVLLRAAEALQTNRVTLARKAKAHGLVSSSS